MGGMSVFRAYFGGGGVLRGVGDQTLGKNIKNSGKILDIRIYIALRNNNNNKIDICHSNEDHPRAVYTDMLLCCVITVGPAF